MRWGILCVLAMIAGKASAASPTWIRVSSPSIELFTDSGENTARAVLTRFETLHRIFHDLYGRGVADSPAPVRVFVFNSPRDFEKYRIYSTMDGFYQTDGEQEFIVLDQGTALKRLAAHEYVHMVIHHASAVLPDWLGEGISEFYSTASVHGTGVRIGESIESHLYRLAHERWLSAEGLLRGNPSNGGIFYAESWALVHMLSSSPEWRDGMPEFVKLLSQGRDQEEAFIKAFGKSMDHAISALSLYVGHPGETTAPAPPAEAPEKYQVTRMAAVDATLTLAELALHTGHPALARSLFLRAAKEHPESGAAIAGLGALARAENRNADALRESRRAIAMGYRDASVYLELGTLKNDDASLERALTIDPRLAEAHFLLGVRATDRGNFRGAIEHLRQAVAIEPRRFTYRHALGYAQAKSGDREGAAESARRSALVASTEEQKRMAAALMQLADDAPARTSASGAKRSDVITPPSWQNRKGDTRVEGTLTEVNCDASPVKLVVSTLANRIELRVEHPAEVELLNAEGASTTLACGEQSRPVAVEYFAATGEIARIEFKHVAIMKR
jgi:tetratricopeptide (TPR) repeat protein